MVSVASERVVLLWSPTKCCHFHQTHQFCDKVPVSDKGQTETQICAFFQKIKPKQTGGGRSDVPISSGAGVWSVGGLAASLAETLKL